MKKSNKEFFWVIYAVLVSFLGFLFLTGHIKVPAKAPAKASVKIALPEPVEETEIPEDIAVEDSQTEEVNPLEEEYNELANRNEELEKTLGECQAKLATEEETLSCKFIFKEKRWNAATLFREESAANQLVLFEKYVLANSINYYQRDKPRYFFKSIYQNFYSTHISHLFSCLAGKGGVLGSGSFFSHRILKYILLYLLSNKTNRKKVGNQNETKRRIRENYRRVLFTDNRRNL